MDDVLKLYIFDDEAEIVKRYECRAYDARLATVEDVAQALGIDRMDRMSKGEMQQAAARCPELIRDALRDMFDGLTPEEAWKVKQWNIAEVLHTLYAWFFREIRDATTGGKTDGQADEDMPLFDALFEIEVNVCQSFPGMDPITLREKYCGELLLLLRRMVRYNRRQAQRKALSGNGDAPAVPVDDDVIVVRKKNGDTVTMRRAKDDRSW